MKFVTNLDLLSNELQNAVVQNLATAPSNAKAGQIYYNSGDKYIYRYDGATWSPIGVVYSQGSTTGAVITGLNASGEVTTTTVPNLTLTGYSPITGGTVKEGMTLEEAMQAMDGAIKSAVAGSVLSVKATNNKGIIIEGTDNNPTVGIKLDSDSANAASLSANGLMVTIPEVTVPEYGLTKDTASTEYAAVYHLTKDGANVGEAINIPKDLFVESGEIVDNPPGQPAGKYIKLVLQNQTDPIYINVADLVDAYTAGNGITISDTNEVAAKVVAGNGLSVDSNGIKMATASASANGAMSSSDFSKLAGIDEKATANTITLNGTATKTPSFYAPSTAGTSGQYLKSNGSGAPTWETITHLKKYTAFNSALTASGGAWTWTIASGTHGVTTPATVQIFDASGNMVMANVTVASGGNVTIVINDTASAGTLAANTYRVVIVG